MQCPGCGADVVRQAIFCHKCGGRLDSEDQQFLPQEVDPLEAAPADSSPTSAAQGTPADMSPTAAEAFREGMTARAGREVVPEEQLWQGGYSPKAMIGAWIGSGLIALALIVLGFVFWQGWLWIAVAIATVLLGLYQGLKLAYRRLNVRYTLTTQRFVHETGILRRKTDRIEVIDMDDITVDQRVVERLVGVGTIWIKSSDTTHPELAMPGIENVKEVAGLIDDTRRQERQRRGLHIESI